MRGKHGKYIATQHLRRLRYPERDALPVFDYIDALGEHPHAKRKLEYAGPAIPGEDELWPLVSNRNLFLADQTIRRLCVTVEGGVGKTKLLEELEATVAYDHPDQVVLRLDLRQLPTEADHFLDSGPQVLARRAWTELKSHRKEFAVHCLPFPESESQDDSDVIPNEVISIVQRAARTGDLCLIVDAFDQLDKQAASDRAQALRDFTGSKYYPKIRCVIAGRPYAIKRVWEDLELGSIQSINSEDQSNDKRDREPVWEFCKLQKFTSGQVKEYLSAVSAEKGREQIEALKRLDAEEIHLPRTLDIIRKIDSGELQQMQTAADLYWHAMNKTIEENFRRSRTEYQLQYLQSEHVRPIVAAVAFAMMFWKNEPVVEVPSLRTDKTRDFFRFMNDAGFVRVLNDEGINFHLELLDLAQIDSESIQFHFYSESPTREAPREVRDIRMSDSTVRDFFAAHWAARYLEPQLEWLRSQGKSPDSKFDLEARLQTNTDSHDFGKFWNLLIGMPNEGQISQEEAAIESSWVTAVTPLFEVRIGRPTKLMYRCWPDLLWRAGFMDHRDHGDVPNWNETPMGIGTRKAQREVKQLFASGRTIQDMGPAKRLVVSFLTNYLAQCKAQEQACMADSKVTSEMKAQFYLDCEFKPIDIKSIPLRAKQSEKDRKDRLAYLNKHYPLWLLERSFRVIDGGLFLYGDNPEPMNLEFVETFEINAYVASNSMYSCFDPREEQRDRDLTAQGSVSWFDSIMFAIWCHGQLPDEYQWEAAARGKVGNLDPSEHWEYGFEGGAKELSDYADFGRSFRERPSSTGNRFPTTRAELYDVHGQLWEWCSSSLSGNARVVRGGSFNSGAFSARCSVRDHFGPSSALLGGGLRVSRARNP